MLETLKNWLGLQNSSINFACRIHEIDQVLHYLVDFIASMELWHPLCQTILSKYSFIWNKGLVNIVDDHEAEK